MQRIAIVGSGIAGLTAAHALHPTHEITVFEADHRVGGHANTVAVHEAGQTLGIDTGFIVYNERNYPAFTAMLEALGVATQPSEMSFSVSSLVSGLEYRTTSVNTLLARRTNLFRPSFARMVADIPRFNRAARRLVESSDITTSLNDFLIEGRFSRPFIDDYLIPLGASIWSADPQRFAEFPVVPLARFLHRHGLLSAGAKPQWRTVSGGSREYVRRLTGPWRDRIRTGCAVRRVDRHPIIVTQRGPVRHVVDPKEEAEARPFDHIVIPRRTRFVTSTEDGPILIQALYAKLARDEVRTTLIVDDVLAAIAAGRSPLVLTERTDHLRDLCQQLEGHGAQVIALQGGAGPKAGRLRAQRLAGVADEERRVLVATGRYIGEGFDDHRLGTLFLALPVSWRGTVQQDAGRLHRLHHRKRVVQIYDYVDASVPMLARMYERRLRGYAAIGYVVAPDAALVLPF